MPLDTNIPLMAKAPEIKGPMDVAERGQNLRQLALKTNQMEQQDQLGKMEMIARLTAGVKDQSTYESAINEARRMNLDVSQFPPVYDPGLVQTLKERTVSYLDRLKNDREQYQLSLQEKQAGIKNQLDQERLNIDRQKANKEKSDLNATQAKQLGLYKLGQKAEEQYQKAVSDPNEYDPTEVGQIIDNSEWAPNWAKNDKAIAAQAAQSNWVEAYLRDASGAAIPPSERMAYAKDFFPRPGDTPEVVANKAELRRQKMDNALTGAGAAGERMVARDGQQKSQQDPDAVKYAQMHGLPYEKALSIISARKGNSQVAGRK